MEPITAMVVTGVAYVSYKMFTRAKHLSNLGKISAKRKKLAVDYLIKSGTLNHSFDSQIILKDREEVVFFAPCTMSRAVRNGTVFVGGTSGYRATVVKGFSISSSGSKGKAVAHYDHEVDDGEIVVTNKRVIFTGPSVNFSTQLRELANVTFDEDSVTFDIEKSTGSDFRILFHSPQITKMFSNKFIY